RALVHGAVAVDGDGPLPAMPADLHQRVAGPEHRDRAAGAAEGRGADGQDEDAHERAATGREAPLCERAQASESRRRNSGGFGLPGDARDVGVIIADRGPALHTVLRRPAVRRLAVRALVVAPDVDVVVDGDLLVLGREIAAGRILRRTALRTAPVRLAEQLPRAASRAIPEHLVDGHALDLGAR